ncbi:MAG: hypothetical protein QNL62_15340 [Gammaproteobacteria bacterium]|nr:hypothetical protein [Gammaproteobacteria bacterium]
MPKARYQQISLSDTPYYHCVSRCVRRAFLCGEDNVTGKNYEHRKEWIQERLKQFSNTFAVEVCAYAIMSNHVHTVLRFLPVQAERWNEQQVISRWRQLFSLPVLIEGFQAGQCDTPAQQRQAQQVIAQWQERLTDLSWFMRCLNEQAVLACMAYVDLNPVRADLYGSLYFCKTTCEQHYKQWTKGLSLCRRLFPSTELVPA